MEKLITYTLIRLFTKNNTDAIRILKAVESLDKKPTCISKPVRPKTIKVKQPVVKAVVPVKELHKPISEKEELLESLSYFQSKSYKTKDDKESIRMIKLMLKNQK
jgi:hypothetical protein